MEPGLVQKLKEGSMNVNDVAKALWEKRRGLR